MQGECAMLPLLTSSTSRAGSVLFGERSFLGQMSAPASPARGDRGDLASPSPTGKRSGLGTGRLDGPPLNGGPSSLGASLQVQVHQIALGSPALHRAHPPVPLHYPQASTGLGSSPFITAHENTLRKNRNHFTGQLEQFTIDFRAAHNKSLAELPVLSEQYGLVRSRHKPHEQW
jgi:hypothetical protein